MKNILAAAIVILLLPFPSLAHTNAAIRIEEILYSGMHEVVVILEKNPLHIEGKPDSLPEGVILKLRSIEGDAEMCTAYFEEVILEKGEVVEVDQNGIPAILLDDKTTLMPWKDFLKVVYTNLFENNTCGL